MLPVSSNMDVTNASGSGLHSMSQQVREVGELRFVAESVRSIWLMTVAFKP